MQSRTLWFALTLGASVASLGFVGCGGGDASAADAEAEVDGDAFPSDQPGASTAPVELALTNVPPQRMERTVSEHCPAAFQADDLAAGEVTGFEAGGQERGFTLYLPDAGAYPGPRPLLVGWHNHVELPEVFALDTARTRDFVDAGFIVALPLSNTNGSVWPVWDAMRTPDDLTRPNADLAFFDALVDCLAAHLEVDEKRVYTGGLGAGGTMASYVAIRRSSLLAGAVVASGFLSLTLPADPVTLDGMVVLITTGGTNDGVTRAGPTRTLPAVPLLEEAATLSAFYDAQAAVQQVQCVGNETGHGWPRELNLWMLEYLLAHPKGMGTNDLWSIDSVPLAAPYGCSEDVLEVSTAMPFECPESTTTGCQGLCTFIGECLVDNMALSSFMQPVLLGLGYSGVGLRDCGGCVATCEADRAVGGDPDVAFLACAATAAEASTCGPGIQGGLPAAGMFNTCCENEPDSLLCERVCTEMGTLEETFSAVVAKGCSRWYPAEP